MKIKEIAQKLGVKEADVSFYLGRNLCSIADDFFMNVDFFHKWLSIEDPNEVPNEVGVYILNHFTLYTEEEKAVDHVKTMVEFIRIAKEAKNS